MFFFIENGRRLWHKLNNKIHDLTIEVKNIGKKVDQILQKLGKQEHSFLTNKKLYFMKNL